MNASISSFSLDNRSCANRFLRILVSFSNACLTVPRFFYLYSRAASSSPLFPFNRPVRTIIFQIYLLIQFCSADIYLFFFFHIFIHRSHHTNISGTCQRENEGTLSTYWPAARIARKKKFNSTLLLCLVAILRSLVISHLLRTHIGNSMLFTSPHSFARPSLKSKLLLVVVSCNFTA